MNASAGGSQRVLDQLEEHSGLRISPIRSYSSHSIEAQTRKGRIDPGLLETIKQRFSDRLHSSRVVDLLVSSNRSSTITSY